MSFKHGLHNTSNSSARRFCCRRTQSLAMPQATQQKLQAYLASTLTGFQQCDHAASEHAMMKVVRAISVVVTMRNVFKHRKQGYTQSKAVTKSLLAVPVCMSTNHVQAIAWLVLGTNCKSYNCGQIPGEIVSSARLEFPFLFL